jgi:hypothetical protein
VSMCVYVCEVNEEGRIVRKEGTGEGGRIRGRVKNRRI